MNDPLDLPTRYRDERVDELPVALGLASLESQLRQEPQGTAPWRRGLAVAAAAAVVAGTAAGGWALNRTDAPTPGVATDPTASATATPSAPGTATAPPTPTATSQPVTPASLEFATWHHPARMMVSRAPGWTPTNAHGEVTKDAGTGWEYQWSQGGKTLSVWYMSPTMTKWQLADCCEPSDSQRVSTMSVLGRSGTLTDTDSGQQMLFLPVQNGYGVRIDMAGADLATFRSVLGQFELTDAAGLDAAMAGKGQVPSTGLKGPAEQALSETTAPHRAIPLPSVGPHVLVNLRGSVHEAVTQAWIDEYERALAAGDQQAMEAAAAGVEKHGTSPLSRDLGMVSEDGDPIATEIQIARAMRERFTAHELDLLFGGAASNDAAINEQQALFDRLKE